MIIAAIGPTLVGAVPALCIFIRIRIRVASRHVAAVKRCRAAARQS